MTIQNQLKLIALGRQLSAASLALRSSAARPTNDAGDAGVRLYAGGPGGQSPAGPAVRCLPV